MICSIVEAFKLARISHKISRKVERGVALDCSKNAREHCQIDKARVFLEQDGVTDRSNWPRVCEKYGLAPISHKLSIKVERGVTLDCSKNAREHCQIDKARVFLEQDGVTDRSNWPRVCEKYGLSPNPTQFSTDQISKSHEDTI